MRIPTSLIALFLFVCVAAAGELKKPQWGEAKDGLRMRLSGEKQSFAAGEAIAMTLEIQNVSDAAKTYRMPVIPFSHTLMVIDENGQEAPYLGGQSGVQIPEKKLKARELQVIRSFNLSDIFYLRRPGRYTVKSHDETHTEAPAPFEFEVLADPQLAAADGDPVGRLLPLVKKDQSLVSHPETAKLNPGGNRGEVRRRTLRPAPSFASTRRAPSRGTMVLIGGSAPWRATTRSRAYRPRAIAPLWVATGSGSIR